jgi:phospholipid/cholesterol/gamma-HCH transport system permease protein
VSSGEIVEPAAGPPAREGTAHGFLREAGALGEFGAQSIRALPGTLRFSSEVFRHAAMMLAGTLPLLIAMCACIGFSQVNYTYFFLRSIGASDFIGAASGFAVPRITATVMLGYVFASKVCCGIVAELGAMKVGDEIDALESTGVDPMKYVVGSRLLAALIFLPIASITALAACISGSYLDVVLVLQGVSAEAFWSLAWSVQTPGDLVNVFVVHAMIVVLCSIVACFYGLRTRGGPEAVGASTARSLLVNLVIVHLVAAVFGVLFYGSESKLPFGG